MAKLARMDGDGVGVNKEVQSSIEKIDEIQNNLDRSVKRFGNRWFLPINVWYRDILLWWWLVCCLDYKLSR